MQVAIPKQKLRHQNRPIIRLMPPWFIEGGLYASLFYATVMGPVWGINIEKLGIVILAGLACICFLFFRERPLDFFKMLVFPIGLGVSYILIQYMYHGLSILNEDYVRSFVPWIFTLIVVQALSFRRGFLHRYAIFSLMLGFIVLPFLDFRAYGDEMTRVALETGMGPLSNSNGLGAWFGFCAVYFFVYGVNSQRHITRLTSWLVAIACFFIVMLTVSRGALVGTVIGIVLASREFLKRGFLPVMLLALLAGIAYGSGMFDQSIGFYAKRATEETGRSSIWPLALGKFLDSPLTGVGASDMLIFVPQAAKASTPHNGFLFVAMAGGIVPLIFYTAYWIQAILAAALKPRNGRVGHAFFALPLVIFSFLDSLLSNLSFMNPYAIVSVAIALESHMRNPLSVPRVVHNKQ